MSIPNHLGKYEIVDILGKGGMGTVYRAHDPSIDRIVALKTIRRELLTVAMAKAWSTASATKLVQPVG